MILTNPVPPRALSEEARSDATRAIQQFPIKRHEPRNSICQVFSQDPSKMSGCLDNFPIVWFWITIGGQYLKQYPSKSRLICLLSPAGGTVSLANGQVRGKCTNSCSFSCPFCNWPTHPRWWHPWSTAWGQCHTVLLLGYGKHHMLFRTCLGQKPLTRPLSWCILIGTVEELSDTPDQPLSASDPLSSLATIARSTLLLSAEAFLTTGMRLGANEKLFTGKCSRWVSSATWQEGMLNSSCLGSRFR